MHLFYRLLADVVVTVHAAYALFIVLGLIVILLGWIRHWEWVRNRTFRLVHLSMILFVVAEVWWGVNCPLTVWEKQLRNAAGQTTYRGDFIAHFVHEALFFNLPGWVFTVCYTAFGGLVLVALWLVPPRWKRDAATSPASFNAPNATEDTGRTRVGHPNSHNSSFGSGTTE